jgi:cation transport ATPase
MLSCSCPQCLLRSAGAAIAIDAADVALFTNDLKCLAPVIKLGRNAKRKILLNISLSVVTKVCLVKFGSHT